LKNHRSLLVGAVAIFSKWILFADLVSGSTNMSVATSFNGECRDWGNGKPLVTIVMWLLNS